jgi:hypothetical protein
MKMKFIISDSKPVYINNISDPIDHFHFLLLTWRMFFAILTNRWSAYVWADTKLEERCARWDIEIEQMIKDRRELETQGLTPSAAFEIANGRRLAHHKKKLDYCELFCQHRQESNDN